MAPLTDAVGLVHRDEWALQTGKQVSESVEDETLRGDVDEFELASGNLAESQSGFLCIEGACQVSRRQTAFVQCRHLIVHQGDEG